jgi:hypothetical protein
VTRPVRPRRWWPWALAAAILVAWAALATAMMMTPSGHHVLSGPEWRHIAADPDAHIGERVVVYGVVTRPGSGTRRDLIRANVDGLDRSDAAGYMVAAELYGANSDLAAGDTFRAEVTVDGSAADVLIAHVDQMSVLARRH